MKSKQTMFFAVISDIEPILKSFEESFQIRYFEMGLFETSIPKQLESIFDLPDLGSINTCDWNYDKRFLILPKNTIVNIREVPQKSGGVKYAVDLSANQKATSLQLGGICITKPDVLVAGKVGTVSEDEFSQKTFKFLSSKLKREFSKIDEFYVGEGAGGRLRLGWRLVLDERRPKGYDLSIN